MLVHTGTDIAVIKISFTVRAKERRMRMKKKIRTINDITAADWEDIKRRREAGANLDTSGLG